MPNPYVNKVVYGNQTLIDLTNDDVLPADVRQGVHFHGADGAPQIGTSSGGTLITKTITANGTYNADDDNADGYSSVTVNVPSSIDNDMYAGKSEPSAAVAGDLWVDTSDEGGLPEIIEAGDTPVLAANTLVSASIAKTAMTASGVSITIPKAGTYRFKFSGYRSSTSGTNTIQVYQNGTAVGTEGTWSSNFCTGSVDVACAADDVIELYGRARSTSYNVRALELIGCINWDMWR